MARRMRPDERQTDLFGVPPQPMRRATPKASRPREPATETPTAEPETITAFAQRAGPADLDELVAVLPDERLAHLALVSARQLRRRLTRTAAGRQRAHGDGKGWAVLDRASQRLSAEWSAPEEAW